MRRGTAFRVMAPLLLFALAVELNRTLERTERARPPVHSLYLPSGKYLRFAALGHPALLADLLYVWSIQYYSDARPERWAYLAQLYDVVTDLDPKFLAAYKTGALILGVEARDLPAALRLLDRGIAANPASYDLPFEAGFYARDLQDWRRSSAYFAVAKDRPGAPDFVSRWYGFTLDRAGDKLQALAFFLDANRRARNDQDRAATARYVHDLTIEVQLDLLGRAVARFREREGRNPVTLDELHARGDLAAAPPPDPDGNPYLYDRQTGKVSAASSFFLRHRLHP